MQSTVSKQVICILSLALAPNSSSIYKVGQKCIYTVFLADKSTNIK